MCTYLCVCTYIRSMCRKSSHNKEMSKLSKQQMKMMLVSGGAFLAGKIL